MKLWGIAQRKDESVHAFASRFQNYLSRLSSYDSTDMQERFIRALLPHLRMPVAQREPGGLPETIRVATHLELLTQTYDRKSGGESSSGGQQTGGRGRGQGGQQGRGAQFGGVQRGRGRGRGRGGAPQCYRCHGWGHIAPNCPAILQQVQPAYQGRGRGAQGQGQRGRGRQMQVNQQGQFAGAGGRGGSARTAAVQFVEPGYPQQQRAQAPHAAPVHPQGNE